MNTLRDAYLIRRSIVFDRHMFLIAATLTFLCLSNALLWLQSQGLRTELLNLRSTVRAAEGIPVGQTAQFTSLSMK